MTPLRVPDGIRKPPVVERISIPLCRCHSALLIARSTLGVAASFTSWCAAASRAWVGGSVIELMLATGNLHFLVVRAVQVLQPLGRPVSISVSVDAHSYYTPACALCQVLFE